MTTVTSGPEGGVRLTDLRRPVLDDVQRLALEYGESTTTDLSADAVLAEARARTGLDDFGPGDFVARLERWTGEIDGDTERTGLGRMMSFGMCVRYATARLRLHDLLSRNPEIDDTEIVAPIVVVGLPRSGTTHLLNLLASDPRMRSLPLWESYEPVPAPGEPATRDQHDARFVRCQHSWEQMQAVVPHQAAMHPMDPAHVNEEIELQGSDFASYILEWVARVPGWRDHYLSTDQTPHYGYMRTALKALQWMHGPDRWVLKSPQHLEQLGPLMATFPDATVVVTHRDPVSVVQSAATMMAYAARVQYRNVDVDGTFDYWADRIERLLGASVRDVDLLPAGRTVHVPFHRFMADEMGTVERIYDVAGRALTDQARAAMQAFSGSHRRDRHGRIAYDLRADFGREPAEVRRRFDFYLERYQLPVEVV